MKFIAMFLPQYHNCDLNSKWWGEGFTEWDNVRSAKPLFQNHRQPRVPLANYYNLLEDGELERQSHMARKYGIEAFSIYHYWSKGKMPLRKPLDLILSSPSININFSITWGNHSWTRSWQNRAGALDVLMEQEYEDHYEDMKNHFDFICKAMKDQRYTLVNNRPLFQIYKPESIPNIDKWINAFRSHALKNYNIDPWISAMVNISPLSNVDELFDSMTTFQPTMSLFGKQSIFENSLSFDKSLIGYLLRSPKNPFKKFLYRIKDLMPDKYNVKNYNEVCERLLKQYQSSSELSNIPLYPMAFSDFDNTPRYKGRALIMEGATPESFAKNILELGKVLKNQGYQEDLIFINAWNEWGEGMYLQPDSENKHSYLEAVHSAYDFFKEN